MPHSVQVDARSTQARFSEHRLSIGAEVDAALAGLPPVIEDDPEFLPPTPAAIELARQVTVHMLVSAQGHATITTPKFQAAADGSVHIVWSNERGTLLLVAPAGGGDRLAYYGDTTRGAVTKGTILARNVDPNTFLAQWVADNLDAARVLAFDPETGVLEHSFNGVDGVDRSVVG